LEPTIGEVGQAEAGDALAGAMSDLMRRVGAPNGVAGVGYGPDDIDGLVSGAAPQRRLLDNAPADIHEAELEALFGSAMTCWGDEVSG
jgi:alcohol dehydrogenase class IV